MSHSYNTDPLHHRHQADNYKIEMEENTSNNSTSLSQNLLPHDDLSNLNNIPSNWSYPPPPNYPPQINNNSVNYESSKKPYYPKVTIWNLNRFIRRIGIYVPNRYCTKMWCVRDCGGYIAAGLTWILILLGEMMILMNCMATHITILSYFNAFVSIAASILGFFSHCQAMFSDPGAVPRGNATSDNIAKMNFEEGQVVLKCVKCESIKPDRAHHCSVCRRCIRKMDHHCPWINNCVGEFNQKFFVLFTGYVCFISTQGFCIALYTLVTCVSSNFSECQYTEVVTLLITVGLMLEGLLFGLFTAIMCGTQLASVCSDQTGIESLKKEKRKRRSGMNNMREVFGGKFSYKWFSPFHPSLDPFDNQYYFGEDSACINF